MPLSFDLLKLFSRDMKKRNFLKIRLRVPSEEQDIVSDELVVYGFDGFEQLENELDAWILEERFTYGIKTQMEEWLLEQSGGRWYIIGEEILQERNWNEEWEKTIRAQRIGRFFVHPTWTDETVPEDAIPIAIDPKMAFGTGYHETTRLLLQQLPIYIRPGDRVLDMGTGTGILAIAALLLGASEATGIDIDPWSYDNALENARMNNVAGRLDIRIGSAESIPPGLTHNVILANINRNILLDLASPLIQSLAPGGFLMLSGIMENDMEAFYGNPLYSRLEQVALYSENEWRALIYRK